MAGEVIVRQAFSQLMISISVRSPDPPLAVIEQGPARVVYYCVSEMKPTSRTSAPVRLTKGDWVWFAEAIRTAEGGLQGARSAALDPTTHRNAGQSDERKERQHARGHEDSRVAVRSRCCDCCEDGQTDGRAGLLPGREKGPGYSAL